MARVRVTSEIGPLRAVLVHTPGPELLAVTPGNREDYLYDDIIDLELAQREHRRFVAVLERVAPGDEGGTLLTELGAGPGRGGVPGTPPAPGGAPAAPPEQAAPPLAPAAPPP